MFNYSKSISSAPLEMVHDPCFSLARVLRLGEASVCWFSAAAKKCFRLLPSRSPQTHTAQLPLPWEHCFGSGPLNFHSGMLHRLSVTGISFFLMQVSGAGWIDSPACDQHRGKLPFLSL